MGDPGGVRRRDRCAGSSTDPDYRRRFSPDDRSGDQPVRSAWAAPDYLRAQQLRLSQRAHAVQGHVPGLQAPRGRDPAEPSQVMGCQGWFNARVRSCGVLDDALKTAEQADGAAYIEVITDANEAPPMYKKLHENVKSFYNIH